MKKVKMMTVKIAMTAVFLSVIFWSYPVKAHVMLTKEEQDYIDGRSDIKAVSLDGAAPLQYKDENGQIKGISKEVLDLISDMTGLKFKFQLYDSVDEVYNSGADIIFGIPYNYATENMAMSKPFLKTETILYINSSVDPNNLEDKIYAATKGSNLPEGIKKENAIYYETRKEAMAAVNRGQADYGYGNAYSVAFYTIQNNYKNIIAVPEKKEDREYCIGFLKNDEILLSILNKAISSLSDTHMRTIILNASTQIERKVTLQMIFEAYGLEIFAVVSIAITILLISIIRNIKAKNELKFQYERYQKLAQTTNEYLYEYNVRTKHLELSNNCVDLFGDIDNLSPLKDMLNQALEKAQNIIPIIELPNARNERGLFKSVHSPIYDDKGRAYSIIGKLVDVSEEEAVKQELIKRSETDSLTGVYNAATTRNLITEIILNGSSGQTDALIVIDCDNFKNINDTYGHLQGDKALISIGNSLIQTFRKTDILGRVGGDEFCVYMRNIPSSDFVVSKCKQLMDLVQEYNQEHPVTLSIGVSIRSDEKSYDDLFKKADIALYEAKKKGRNQIYFS